MDSMESRLVAQALNYHGQQLQKVWEGERNENELVMLNLKDPNFEIYQQRQKTLSFGDRGKRLKLQQFIAKKADTLYDKSNLDKINEPVNLETRDEEFYATMPGLDSFVPMEKTQRIRNFLESLIVGDVIYAQVMGKSNAGLLLKIICNCSDCPRVVIDLAIKALILNTATVPAVDKKGATRSYMTNDLVCVAVSEVNVEAERVVGVMNISPREGQASHPSLGLIHIEDLPDAYKKVMDNKGQGYDKIMESSSGFNNPNNIKYLSGLLDLGSEHHSNMVGLKERFPPSEFASELRQVQASKWAFRSVADGIDHFKAGRHTEAFQCLNKALTVDPKNVEGLVARGALYANSGSFKKAIEDFETALKLNQTHANARKYMAETLVALGRSYEDEKKFEDAQKAYEDCLAIAPYHEEARNSIEYIKTKTTNPTVINPLEPFKTSFDPEAEPVDAKKEKKKRKKERKSRSKKRQRWSSSSDSSSSGSSSSSSSDSSSSSSSESSTRSTSRSPNRKRKHKKDHHPSLSPLSKRMNQCNNPPATSSNSQDGVSAPTFSGPSKDNVNDYDVKVMKFLEQTQDDSDYEDKVRRFLEETARWKKEKEKKVPEIDKSKKKKKKEKKGKDKEDKKSRKKKRKEERKKRRSKDKLERDLEALKRSSLPDLEQLESKLSAYHAKVEKKTVLSSRFSSHFNEMPSPLHHSNADKLSDVSRRDDDHFRREREKERERDDAGKSYHERDSRMQIGPQQRKSFYPEVQQQQRKSMGGDLFDSHHPSQMVHQDQKMPPLDTAALNAKWRAAQAARGGDDSGSIGKWQNIHPDNQQSGISDNELDNKIQRTMEKSFGIRKQQIHRDQDKRSSAAGAPPSPPLIIQKEPVLLSIKQNTIKYPTPQPQNKFQSYKDTSRPQSPNKYTSSLGGKFQPIGQSHPPEPPGPCPPSKRSKGGSHSDSDSDDDNNDRRRLSRRRDDSRNSNNGAGGGGGGRRLSRERQLRRSRTRSRSGSRSSSGSRSRSVRRSRSRTYSNRRSGSYERKYSRSQSGSYSRSRSRSRSRSYTRSRSRSRSNDRGHYRKRQFRQFNNRGTYYKPRFQGFNNHQNHRGGGGQNNYQNRNNRFYNNNGNNQHNNRFNNRNRGNYNNRGQNRGRMNNRGGGSSGGGGGGRFFHNNKPGFRDYRNRRDFRDRRGSRDRYSDRSYSPDPMRKVDEAKEKINKMLEGDEGVMDRNEQQVMPPLPPNKRHDGPLSEGEERDDDDYERWTEADNQDTSKTNEQFTGVDGRDNFIERMKQRSKNVLIQREAAAKAW